MPTNARFGLKLVWYISFLIRLCVIVLSGVRLAAFHSSKLTDDPTKAMWLFAVLAQIQIFLSLSAAGFPALKRTILDLTTSFGVSEQSQSRSYILKSLTGKSKEREPPEERSWPFGAGPSGEGIVRAGASRAPSDDGSQQGIMRRDEYEITVTNNDGSEGGSH
ncbi:hypothetical protein LTR17_024584 [Elasticomyces elasticus]|nr:hypothetical protein LTR17_024584 [Elasticomyces elasticus]